MKDHIDIDTFIKDNQDQIYHLVNNALNKAGEAIQKKVSAGEIGPSLQEVLPLLLYEILVTHTVSVLKLVSEMVNPDN
ncbi:MAG: hypothetical protein ACOY4I_11800 [Bacillota bacterium]